MGNKDWWLTKSLEPADQYEARKTYGLLRTYGLGLLNLQKKLGWLLVHCNLYVQYLRAILCTFQISVDFYFVPVSGRGGGRGGAGEGDSNY